MTIKQLLDDLCGDDDSEEFWAEYLDNQLSEYERPCDELYD